MKFDDNGWDQLFSGNAMIRAWVAQPHDSVHNIGCRIARYSNFDPNGNPTAGTITELSSQCYGYIMIMLLPAWEVGVMLTG